MDSDQGFTYYAGIIFRIKRKAKKMNHFTGIIVTKSSAGGQGHVTIRCGLNFKERFESELHYGVRFC